MTPPVCRLGRLRIVGAAHTCPIWQLSAPTLALSGRLRIVGAALSPPLYERLAAEARAATVRLYLRTLVSGTHKLPGAAAWAAVGDDCAAFDRWLPTAALVGAAASAAATVGAIRATRKLLDAPADSYLDAASVLASTHPDAQALCVAEAIAGKRPELGRQRKTIVAALGAMLQQRLLEEGGGGRADGLDGGDGGAFRAAIGAAIEKPKGLGRLSIFG